LRRTSLTTFTSVDPGFGQFTYHFVPSQTQVNVVSARTQANSQNTSGISDRCASPLTIWRGE
jgi:hypothetical protein